MGNNILKLDIAAISHLTGIPPRRLRYVLDHDIFVLEDKPSSGRGSRRNFIEYEAYGIACAALLLEGGLRQATVRGIMGILTKSEYGYKMGYLDALLLQALNSDKAALLEVGDGVNVRLSTAGSQDTSVYPVRDTGWRQVATGEELSKKYQPLIKVSIDAKRLRQQLKIFRMGK